MTLDARVRLYQFSRGVLRWLYCTADRDISVGTALYRSLRGGISDQGIRYTADARADALEITAPADIDVAQPWRVGMPSDQVGLTVYDMRYGESVPVFVWAGRIGGVVWPALDRCKISCVSRDAELDEPGLTDVYSRGCGALLGDPECGVDLNPLRVDLPIQSMDGVAVFSAPAAGYPDHWFTAGYVEWPIGQGEYDRRRIDQHLGTELRLLGGTAGIPLAAVLRAYPGCDGVFLSSCVAKFGNGDRFRGIPHLENRSPFDGNAVW